MTMDNDQQRDPEEEQYNRRLLRSITSHRQHKIDLGWAIADTPPINCEYDIDLIYRVLCALYGPPTDVDRAGPLFTWEPAPGVVLTLNVDEDA